MSVQSDYDRGPGNATPISIVVFDDSGIQLQAWSGRQHFDQILTVGAWHEVSIRADREAGTQDLRIDGILLGRVEDVEHDVPAVAVVIIGDTAGAALKGAYVWDDVSPRRRSSP